MSSLVFALKSKIKSILNKKCSIQMDDQKVAKLNMQLHNLELTRSQLIAENNQKSKTINNLSAQISALTETVHQLTEEKARAFQDKTDRIGVAVDSRGELINKTYPTMDAEKGFDLGNQLNGFFGNHRSGWPYAVSYLAPLHKPHGIYLDMFIERTFVWSPEGVRPHNKPWIGFIHVPPNVPDWFQYEQSNQSVFQTSAWKDSIPNCRGLITLSGYHREALEKQFDFPIRNLLLPNEIPELIWNFDNFIKNKDKKIIQLGWWLRKLHAIYQLPASDYRKIFLKVTEQSYLKVLMDREKKMLVKRGEFDDSMYDSVDVVSYLADNEYDKWLSENIAFLDLYDSSANNAVVECIVRGTPLLVNPLPSIVEYIGKDYPFYYKTYSEAIEKASNLELVKAVHEYLLACPTRNKLSGDYFRESLLKLDFS